MIRLALPLLLLAPLAAGAQTPFLRFGTDARNLEVVPYVQVDAGHVRAGSDAVEEGGEAELRRARLYLLGSWDAFGGALAYQFHNSDYPWYDAYLTWAPTDRLTLRAGQDDQRFSLEDLSGSDYLPFAESGRTAALGPGDDVGLAFLYGADRFSLSGGVYGGDVNTGVLNEGVSLTTRLTGVPALAPAEGDAAPEGATEVRRMTHLGAAATLRFGGESAPSFSSGAATSLSDATLVASPPFRDLDALLLGNLEAARVLGPWKAQAELTGGHVDSAGASGFVAGAYLYGTVFLTGERHAYDRTAGTFARVIPDAPVDAGGWGAYELGARIDWLDLTDLGGEAGAQAGVSLVGNAYLTETLTLSLDLSGTHVLAGAQEGLEVGALTARLQISY